MSIARGELKVTAWDRTVRCHLAGFRLHAGPVVIVQAPTIATGGHCFRVFSGVTVGEVIAKSAGVRGEVRSRQQHVPEARK
jgi:hypothetical protein